jgi:hypothetical protein
MKDIYQIPETGDIEVEIGTVIDVNPATFSADVALEGGRSLQGVGFIGVYGSPFGQDITWIHNLRGAVVKLALIGREYFIIHTLPGEIAEKDDIHSSTIPVTEAETGGADELTYKDIGFSDYSGNRNTSFLQADKVLRADADTEVSVWKAGIVRLKAGPLAQFILNKYKAFARLVSRTYQFFSDFGEVASTHDSSGRVGLHIKGGADFTNETHPSSEKWTIQVWYGNYPGDPDARLHIKVNDADETNSVELQYDINGNQTLDVSNDDTQTIGNDKDHTIVGDETITVGGDSSKSIVGDEAKSVGGNKTTTVLGNNLSSTTGNDTQEVTGNLIHTVTGTWTVNVVGPVVLQSATAVTVTAPVISLN